MNLVVEYVIDLVSASNRRRGRRDAIGRTRRHREAAKLHLLAASRRTGLVPRLPCTITMTRFGVRPLDEPVNLGAAFKATQDGIACRPTRLRPAGFLEVDDADPRLAWIIRQVVVPKAEIGPLPEQARVRIEIEWKEPQ